MALNFNTDPYYDDYNESKNFQRILFKPGVAVQARELTQLQTILQNQIARFGNHVFKPGSMVIPGNTFYDKNFNYVKLVPTYSSVDINVNNYLGREITGQTSGVVGKVITVSAATDTDPPTLFVKYTNSGTNFTTAAFSDSEVIATSDTGTTYYATVATSATGKCLGVSINTGVYFVKDNFVRVSSNTIILDKYLSNSTYKVGLEVNESIVTSDDDESLLDPAIGTYNYFAPGSDRYKIDLVLSKRAITDTTTSDTFIELLRVVDGDLVDLVTKPGYNILADELARRTYDESGNYTVDPFGLKFIEHLKSNVHPDGYLTAAGGGNSTKAIAVLGPGKSYVKGYEVSTISNRYLDFNKPRDNVTVQNAFVQTPIGNYINVNNVYSIPNFTSDLITVNLYNAYTATKGTASGTLVGNAYVRGIETTSSNVMSNASTFSTFLFSVNMKNGYTFERDVKQLYHTAVSDSGYVSTAFTADIVPNEVLLAGTVTLGTANTTVVGVNTNFTTDLKVGDYINFTSDSSNSYQVATVTSTTQLTLSRGYAAANISGVNYYRNSAVIQDKNKSSYIYPFDNSVISNLADITMKTRKVFYGTLSSGNVAISTGVGTIFSARTDTDYYAVGVTSTAAGKLYYIGSSNFSYTDGTYRNVNINLSSYGLTNQDVLIYTTIINTNPAAKTKTATVGQTTYTTQSDCQTPIISLGYADAYAISNVKMSSNVFGTAYNDSNSIDVTSNYTLVDGQTATYYGISSVQLKPGAPVPTGPIQINFKYYAHGAGDYFSVVSYPDYENIPVFNKSGIVYNLRDCLDFRARIDNTGVNFKGTGASKGNFLDYAQNFQTDYTYYLPRIDKIYLTSDDNIVYKEGVSSLTPIEPLTPVDAMPLYVIEHPAYGFDINRDSTFTPVDQKRYTMKDIGKLESRIQNLEYYTTLSLLELDTAVFSIKDSFGLDRYKNGFIVDSFRGHGVGDVRNPDYNVSMDFTNGVLKPGFFQKNIKLSESNTTDVQRAAAGYKLINNDTIMLSYTDEEYISVNVASDAESITPFDNYTFTGVMTLSPPGDTWYDTSTKPLIYKDNTGAYDTLIPDAVGQKTYGSIWDSWKQFWYSPGNNDKVTAIDAGAVITNAGVTGDSKSVVFPYVRNNTITFTAKKLKPNTLYYAFFHDYNVTAYCTSGTSTANVAGFNNNTTSNTSIITDSYGSVVGVFNFNTETTGLKVPSGTVTFRLTDSATNNANKESFADALFVSNGTLNQVDPPRTNYNAIGATITNGDGNGSTETKITLAAIQYAIAALLGIKDPTQITQAQIDQYSGYFKYTNKEGVILKNFDDAKFATYSPSTTNYGTVALRAANSYNFNISSNYSTATNIMQAVNTTTGKSFVQDAYNKVVSNLGTTNGPDAWDSVVMPVYDGFVGSTTDVVKTTAGADGSFTQAEYNSLPQDMRSFWEAGIANGSFTATPDGVSTAIENYAAAQTLGYLDNNTAFAQAAATAAAANGLIP